MSIELNESKVQACKTQGYPVLRSTVEFQYGTELREVVIDTI